MLSLSSVTKHVLYPETCLFEHVFDMFLFIKRRNLCSFKILCGLINFASLLIIIL